MEPRPFQKLSACCSSGSSQSAQMTGPLLWDETWAGGTGSRRDKLFSCGVAPQLFCPETAASVTVFCFSEYIIDKIPSKKKKKIV